MLTPELRKELKIPLGQLIEGSFEETSKRIAKLVSEKKPKKLITIGDQVTMNMISSSILPDVAVVDSKIMRKAVPPVKFEADSVFQINNPPGTITDESWETIKKAINSLGRSKVIVNGEEDLLTIVAVLSAPCGSIVMYGQPNRGVVVLNIEEEVKKRFKEIIKRMKKID
ncbi:DUF359 domain-containing protein [Candidatus Bathyarchaeota archaeon]|nr:MAG: DUF359 domain-containing protein [Candidatus Bathyarchaeota archaeon]